MINRAIELSVFSQNGDFLSGRLPLSGMSRLQNALAAETAEAAVYTLQGEAGNNGLFLNMTVTAVLPLLCQRCLQPFDFQLDIERRFKVQANKKEEIFCEDYEVLDVDDIVPVDFLEEEILLSLPFAPAHALSQCSMACHIAA